MKLRDQSPPRGLGDGAGVWDVSKDKEFPRQKRPLVDALRHVLPRKLAGRKMTGDGERIGR